MKKLQKGQSPRLLYEPSNPHQAGCSIWLVHNYKKQDKDRRRPRWQQWLKIRNWWMKQQEEKFGKDNLTCAICGRTGMYAFQSPNRPKKDLATIDHILPVSKFPHLWNRPSNFQVACCRCNYKKQNSY